MAADVSTFDDAPKLADEKPPNSAAHVCSTCGVEVERPGGRGRWPTSCPEHKPKPHGASGGAKKSGQNAQLAQQASEALCQVNALVAMGLMLAQLPETGSALALREDAFREQAYAALLTDPQLARTILKAGTTSGRISLGIAYAMLGASVAPIGVLEFKAGREGRNSEDRAEDPQPAAAA